MLSGERRDVTVLFSDLRGFTSFAEKLRPEEVTAILNDHCDLLVELIARRGGFVVDFLGDAVFAVFGAPRPLADHAERAVACAIEIQRAREARNEETRARGWPRLEMGVGLDTGSAVVGNMGSVRRIKYGVVGHVVNAASRIESLTVGGQVLISETTRAALGDRLVVDGPYEVEGKGLGASMDVWEVTALRSDPLLGLPSPVTDLATLAAPLGGRIHLILGKKIDPRAYDARVLRLAAGGVELESDAPLTVFAPLQVHLLSDAEAGIVEPLDGKVVSVTEQGQARGALVRFTGVDWDTRARLERLAGRRPAGASPAAGG
jgi:adenylate cyclase